MKKVLVTLVAVATLAAFAGTASAVTCTIDHKPSATLLLPYFQTMVSNAGGSIVPAPFNGGLNGTDTLVTIVNASAAPVLAHVTVWNSHSEAVLDFNVGLTGFDVLPFSMASVLTGTLPTNPATDGDNACTNSDFRRFSPTSFPSSDDTSATTDYGDLPNYPNLFTQDFIASLAAELDGSDPCLEGGIDPAFGANGTDTLIGYVTIDMVNYCTFANPNNAGYWADNAGGFENTLWGDYTIQSEGTTPTYGSPLIGFEADVTELNGTNASTDLPIRTFYARYWETTSGDTSADPGGANNGGAYFATIGLFGSVVGDMREPLGVTYGARYLNIDVNTTSFLRAWRGGADAWTDLCGSESVEPNVFTVIWDQDEHPAQQHGCTFSPCPEQETFNIPLETQRTNIVDFAGSAASAAGWLYIDFGANGTVLDQAWLGYDFSVPGAFANAGIDGVSFDANNCQPAEFAGSVYGGAFPEVPTPPNADGVTGFESF